MAQIDLIRWVLVLKVLLVLTLATHAFQLSGGRGCAVPSMWMRTQGNKRRAENREAAVANKLGNSAKPASSSAPRPVTHCHSRIEFKESSSAPSSHFVQALRARAQFSDAPFDRDERQQLALALEHHVPKMNKAELVSTVNSLGVCSYNKLNWQSGGGGSGPLLWRSLWRSSAAHSFNAQDLSSVLVAAARMEWRWDQAFASESRTVDLIETILADPEAISDEQAGDILWGLGSVGLRLQDHSPSTAESVIGVFNAKAGRFNGYALSSSLWALAKMGARWTDMSHSLRQRLPARLLSLGVSASMSDRASDRVSENESNNDSDSGSGRDSSATYIHQARGAGGSSSSLSPQQSSKILWSLGTLGLRFDDTLTPLIDAYLMSVGSIKRSKMGGAVPASQTLVGLAKLGVPWERLSPMAQDGVLEQVERVCHSSNERGITSAVWALGTLGVPVESVPQDVLETMLTGMTRSAANCNAWALCNIVWGMAKMGFDWLQLPVAFRQMLMTNIDRLEPDMNSQDASILIWSLGSIDTPLDALPPFFTEKLLRATQRNMDTMRPEELSRTIWGLSSAELSWDSLPSAVRWNLNVNLRRVGEAMAPQDVANCAYGLAILAFDTKEPSDPAFRGAHEALLNTIMNNRDKILARLRDDPSCTLQGQEFEQLRIFSHYLGIMGYVSDPRRIPAEFLLRPSIHTSSVASNINGVGVVPAAAGGQQKSRLQSRVTKGLVDGLAEAASSASHASADQNHHRLEVEPEVSSFGGVFPVDAGISQDGEIIALIEIDGPHHYRPCDGRLRRKDRLKEAMYRKALPDCAFYRIRWDDANKVGTDIVGEELAGILMANARDRNKGVIEGAFQKMMRQAGSFFAWGMRNE